MDIYIIDIFLLFVIVVLLICMFKLRYRIITGGAIPNIKEFKNRFNITLKLFKTLCSNSKIPTYGIVTEFDQNEKWTKNIKGHKLNAIYSPTNDKWHKGNVIISNTAMKSIELELELKTLPNASIVMTHIHSNIILCGVHFPANVKEEEYNVYFSEINKLIAYYSAKEINIIFAGDFNQFVSRFETNVPNYKIISSGEQTGFSGSNEEVNRKIDVIAIPDLKTMSAISISDPNKFLGNSKELSEKISGLPVGDDNKEQMKERKGCLYEFIEGQLSDHAYPVYELTYEDKKFNIACLSQLGDKRLFDTAYYTKCTCKNHPEITIPQISEHDCEKDNAVWHLHELLVKLDKTDNNYEKNYKNIKYALKAATEKMYIKK
jgi:hypothetical protein